MLYTCMSLLYAYIYIYKCMLRACMQLYVVCMHMYGVCTCRICMYMHAACIHCGQVYVCMYMYALCKYIVCMYKRNSVACMHGVLCECKVFHACHKVVTGEWEVLGFTKKSPPEISLSPSPPPKRRKGSASASAATGQPAPGGSKAVLAAAAAASGGLSDTLLQR